MLSVVIPTLNAADTLPACLAALVPAVVDGVVGDVVIADGGSTDRTRDLAEDAGCTIVACAEAGRGPHIRAGIAAARHGWLLVLHADTVLEDGWADEAAKFMAAVDSGARPLAAAAFQLAFDDDTLAARLTARGVALRCAVAKLPYGDQGLLVPKRLLDSIGGYPALPLMEDVAVIRAIPRRQRVMLRARAITSARRYRRDGYVRRIVRNWACLALYFAGAKPDAIARLYRGGNPSR